MKSISITTYRGFSKVKGKCSLQELIGWVRSRQYANLIEKIGRLVSEGKTKEAENVKRQLDYFTVTANYHECRLAHSIAAYNDTSSDRSRRSDARLFPHRQAARFQNSGLPDRP